MRPIIELKKEVGHALPDCPEMPTLRGEHRFWYDVLPLSVMMIVILILGILAGMKIAAPEEIRRQQAWDVQVETYNKCFDLIVKPIPVRAREIRQARSASCVDVAEGAMNGMYQAGGVKR